MQATAATVRRGAINRATAPAAEDITSGKLVLQISEHQSTAAGEGALGGWPRRRVCRRGCVPSTFGTSAPLLVMFYSLLKGPA
jgi:hypothetical protein